MKAPAVDQGREKKKLRGVLPSLQTVAMFVVGLLSVGIVVGLFNIISGMKVNVNGTAYNLIPTNIANTATNTTNTLISVIIAVAIVFILLPVVYSLMGVFGGRGR